MHGANIVDRIDYPLLIHCEGMSAQGAGIGEAGKGEAHVRGYADDGAVFTQLREAVFIVRNDQLALCASPRQSGAAIRRRTHQIAATVPGEHLIHRRLQPLRHALQLLPDQRELSLHGCAHALGLFRRFQGGHRLPQRRLPDFCLPGLTTKRAKLLTDRKSGTSDCDCFHIVIIHLCSGYVLQKLLQTRIAAGREQRLR